VETRGARQAHYIVAGRPQQVEPAGTLLASTNAARLPAAAFALTLEGQPPEFPVCPAEPAYPKEVPVDTRDPDGRVVAHIVYDAGGCGPRAKSRLVRPVKMSQGNATHRCQRVIPDLDTIVDRLMRLCERHQEILCAWIFGSRARGTARPASDVDIAILLRTAEPVSPWGDVWGDLHHELVRALGVDDDDVDLVFPDRVRSVLLAHRATWSGRLVFCRDQLARVKLQTGIALRYLDGSHLRRHQWDVLRRQAVDGA